MVVSLKANRKRILAFFVLALVVVGALFFLHGGEQEEQEPIPGGTNEERVAFWRASAGKSRQSLQRPVRL